MDEPRDHNQMAADLDDLRRSLERQWRDLESRTPLWEEEPEADADEAPPPAKSDR